MENKCLVFARKVGLVEVARELEAAVEARSQVPSSCKRG